MMRKRTAPYTCWRCVQRGLAVPSTRQPVATLPWGTSRSSLARASGSSRSVATTAEHVDPIDDPDATEKMPIRERLQKWLDTEAQSFQKPLIRDLPAFGRTQNMLSRPETPRSIHVLETSASLQDSGVFDGGEVMDLRILSMPVEAGDLIEFRSDMFRTALVAVCLGRFNGVDHFYTSSGKWYASQGGQSRFVVHGFAKLSELQPIIDALPSGGFSLEDINILKSLNHIHPTRTLGHDLLKKMDAFLEEAKTVFRVKSAVLTSAYDRVRKAIDDPAKIPGSHGQDYRLGRYHTLYEIAEILIPDFNTTGEDVRFTNNSPVLYAVHQALQADEIGFRPILDLTKRQHYLFEVTSPAIVQCVRYVEKLMRARGTIAEQTLTGQLTSRHGVMPVLPKQTAFDGFVSRCQAAIDASRQRRSWSPHGIVGLDSREPKEANPEVNWQESDRPFLEFLFLWAAEERIPRGSPLLAVGGAMLRAIDRYQDVTYLDSSVAWTCLQEIQLVSPWDIQARYKLGLPRVNVNRHKGIDRPRMESESIDVETDILRHKRKDWGPLAAFCIDAPTTTDIDDGISLERTGKDDEFFVHIHIADPGSCVLPGSQTSKKAELLPQTMYLPGHFERMFDDPRIRKQLSLAPDNRCLTFTAKVNLDGEVLETSITPGTLRKVIYIENKEVHAACGIEPPMMDFQRKSFSVGTLPEDPISFYRGLENVQTDEDDIAASKPPSNQEPSRKMTTAAELSEAHRNDLRTLSEIAKALHKTRLGKGAMPLYWPRPAAQVSFESASASISGITIDCAGDPCIRVYYPSGADPLVESLMRLAGEVAAQWCIERNIPIPFRTQPQAIANAEQISQFSKDVIYPQLLAGKRPSERDTRTFRSLIGTDEITARPGVHITMGTTAYTKATSPLRRYTDLLVHWQIEAALLTEARHGTSLKGIVHDTSSDPSEKHPFLPFSRAQLEQDVLPMLRVRERLMKRLDNLEGNQQWMLQALVRAWKFGDASPTAENKLPETFKFTVVDVLGRRALRGRLDWFDMNALMEKSELVPSGVPMADVCVDDVYEVELVDVNVHTGRVFVRALRKVEGAEGADAAQS